MTGEILIVDRGGTTRRIKLSDYLDAAADERATMAAHAWIKQLRQLHVEGGRCGGGSRCAAIRCGGSPSCTCTNSR